MRTTGTEAPDCHEQPGRPIDLCCLSELSLRVYADSRSKHRVRSGYCSPYHSIQNQSMLRGTATNYYSDACLCAWHPCGKDTISFRLIVSQHCCFMTVGSLYTPGKLPFT